MSVEVYPDGQPMKSGAHTRLAFRADLQSLRALAIVLVIAAHAGVPFLQGGYVGVDVFFVLSGYLISGLVWDEVQGTRRFDAVGFYARRFKRLAPALILVLVSVAVFGWLLSGPQRQLEDSAAAKAAAVWLSNFYFSARVINYFSSGATSNLFLHTWSLGVEEQFYVVWPWLMLFLLGAFAWQGRQFDRRRLLGGWIAISLISLGLGVYWSHTQLELAFYLMPGRAWEFGFGALTFALREKFEFPRWARAMLGRSILNALGYVLIIAAAVTLDDSLRYPGLFALWPSVGAVFVLLDRPERGPGQWLSRFLLRARVPQFIGNLSYSLYLWHWPVLLLGQSFLGHSAWVRLGMVALALLLASLTYFWVEQPVHRRRLRSRPWPVLGAGIVSAGLAFVLMSQWQDAARELLQSPPQLELDLARWDLPALYSHPGCDTWYHSADVRVCDFGPAQAKHTAVIFGDSVMAQWFPAIASIYLAKPDWRVAVLTKSSCSASQVSYTYNKAHGIYAVCNLWRQRAIAEIERLRPDIVYLGSTHYAFTQGQWIEGTRSVLARLSPVVGCILVMNPSPELGFDGIACLSARANLPHWLSRWKTCSNPLAAIGVDSVHTALEMAIAPFANAHLIDLRHVICPQQTCRAELRGQVVYRDGQHMTASFVQSLAPALLSVIPTEARPQ